MQSRHGLLQPLPVQPHKLLRPEDIARKFVELLVELIVFLDPGSVMMGQFACIDHTFGWVTFFKIPDSQLEFGQSLAKYLQRKFITLEESHDKFGLQELLGRFEINFPSNGFDLIIVMLFERHPAFKVACFAHLLHVLAVVRNIALCRVTQNRNPSKSFANWAIVDRWAKIMAGERLEPRVNPTVSIEVLASVKLPVALGAWFEAHDCIQMSTSILATKNLIQRHAAGLAKVTKGQNRLRRIHDGLLLSVGNVHFSIHSDWTETPGRGSPKQNPPTRASQN